MAETARKEEKPRPQPVIEARLAPAETRRNEWHLDIEVPAEGIEPEELLDPAYWAHVAAKLRPFDRLECHAEDGSWYAEYLVRDVGANWAKVQMRYKLRLDPITPETRRSVLSGFAVRWKGNFRRWCVVREVDSKIIKDGLAVESEAYAWLADYARTALSPKAQS